MAMTLADLSKMFPPVVKGHTAEEVPHQSLPFWVVVLSKKPNPDGTARFKFVIGKATEEEANAEAEERTKQSVRPQVKEGTSPEDEEKLPRVPGFQFFVIKNPHGGQS